jgi:hypothetical protein
MTGRFGLVAGFGIGYVLGERAGRTKYEQIAGKAHELWRDPRLQEKAGRVQQALSDKVGDRTNGWLGTGSKGQATPDTASGAGPSTRSGTTHAGSAAGRGSGGSSP